MTNKIPKVGDKVRAWDVKGHEFQCEVKSMHIAPKQYGDYIDTASIETTALVEDEGDMVKQRQELWDVALNLLVWDDFHKRWNFFEEVEEYRGDFKRSAKFKHLWCHEIRGLGHNAYSDGKKIVFTTNDQHRTCGKPETVRAEITDLHAVEVILELVKDRNKEWDRAYANAYDGD